MGPGRALYGAGGLALGLVLPALDLLDEVPDALLAFDTVNPLLHARELSQLVWKDVAGEVESLLVLKRELDRIRELCRVSSSKSDEGRPW